MSRLRSTPSRSLGPIMGRMLLLGLGLGTFLVTVVILGKYTRESVQDSERYSIAFLDIECVPPTGYDREGFLSEVQSAAQLPERLSLLDHDLHGRLVSAFGRHPYVDKVEQVTILSYPRVQVRLTYRVPVLEIM